MRFARGFALASLALIATACTDRIDVPGLESRLAADLQAQYSTSFTVSCPDDVEVGKGNDFECAAEGEDGTTLTLQMTQVDDEASVTYEIVEG
jgi:Domain of unknown function (DUF4333)